MTMFMLSSKEKARKIHRAMDETPMPFWMLAAAFFVGPFIMILIMTSVPCVQPAGHQSFQTNSWPTILKIGSITRGSNGVDSYAVDRFVKTPGRWLLGIRTPGGDGPVAIPLFYNATERVECVQWIGGVSSPCETHVREGELWLNTTAATKQITIKTTKMSQGGIKRIYVHGDAPSVFTVGTRQVAEKPIAGITKDVILTWVNNAGQTVVCWVVQTQRWNRTDSASKCSSDNTDGVALTDRGVLILKHAAPEYNDRLFTITYKPHDWTPGTIPLGGIVSRYVKILYKL